MVPKIETKKEIKLALHLNMELIFSAIMMMSCSRIRSFVLSRFDCGALFGLFGEGVVGSTENITKNSCHFEPE